MSVVKVTKPQLTFLVHADTLWRYAVTRLATPVNISAHIDVVSKLLNRAYRHGRKKVLLILMRRWKDDWKTKNSWMEARVTLRVTPPGEDDYWLQ